LGDAEKLVRQGWAVFNLPLEKEFARRSDVRRVCVAAVVKERTTVPLAWLAARVGLSSAANVSQQVRRLPQRLETHHAEIRRQYQKWRKTLS
ncbi:MAG: hypothetical protein ACR2OZ_02635, partial [Verrucomicrobiales bacterium]